MPCMTTRVHLSATLHPFVVPNTGGGGGGEGGGGTNKKCVVNMANRAPDGPDARSKRSRYTQTKVQTPKGPRSVQTSPSLMIST